MKTGLVDNILAGDVQASARLMRRIEEEAPGVLEELKRLYPHTGRAYVIGVTGAPGVGKSTLIDALISIFRQEKLTVGILAVDPTSPISGGALLGDRIRMQKHSADNGVFIRSLASRGCEGGLSKPVLGMLHVLDAMGKDIILVETAGVGQIETGINRVSDTCVVILAPGAGDGIQLMKAGILEIADILVVNKADKDGADLLKGELAAMLTGRTDPSRGWQPSIILAEAVRGKGSADLVQEIFRHRQFLASSGELAKRRRERAKLELTELIEGSLRQYLLNRFSQVNMDKMADDVMTGKADPYSKAEEVIALYFKEGPSLR